MASRRGHLEIVKLLIASGSELDIHTSEMWTGVMWAADCGHENIVRELLKTGADGTSSDTKGFTPFLQACQNGHLEVAKVLATGLCQLDIEHITINRWSGLMVACKNGHVKIVTLLINLGCEVNYAKEDGTTALHVACYKGHAEVVEKLLMANAHGDCVDEEGYAPAMYACKMGHVNILQILLKFSEVDLNRTCLNGTSLLLEACSNMQPNVVKFLLDNSADVNYELPDGTRAIHIAGRMGSAEIVDILCQVDSIKLDGTDRNGKTVLQYATPVAKLLDIVAPLLMRNLSLAEGLS